MRVQMLVIVSLNVFLVYELQLHYPRQRRRGGDTKSP